MGCRGQAWLAAALLLLPAGPARANRVRIDTIDLGEVIRRSSAIVVVEPLGPFRAKRRLTLAEGVRPLSYVDSRYRVIRHLFPAAARGKTLVVSSFDARAIELHLERLRTGRNRGHAVDAYTASQPLSAEQLKQRHILFLRSVVYMEHDAHRNRLKRVVAALTPVCWGAVEAMAAEKTILDRTKTHTAAATQYIVGVERVTDTTQDRVDELLSRLNQGRSYDSRLVELPRRRGRR